MNGWVGISGGDGLFYQSFIVYLILLGDSNSLRRGSWVILS